MKIESEYGDSSRKRNCKTMLIWWRDR